MLSKGEPLDRQGTPLSRSKIHNCSREKDYHGFNQQTIDPGE